MEVVFIQDVQNQAHAGEVKKVSDGYARNYLIPKGLAAMATPEVLKRVHKITSAGDQRRIAETQVMQELAQLIDKASIAVTARVTPAGRYYGAITAGRVAELLTASLGRTIERRLVDNMEPIREPGEYDVVLRLSGDITATIHVKAEAEE
jgi:large subunit ribosomal protein L9